MTTERREEIICNFRIYICAKTLSLSLSLCLFVTPAHFHQTSNINKNNLSVTPAEYLPALLLSPNNMASKTSEQPICQSARTAGHKRAPAADKTTHQWAHANDRGKRLRRTITRGKNRMISRRMTTPNNISHHITTACLSLVLSARPR